MELRQLKCFITVCTCRSMSKAAEELFITQQALSKVISNFEKEIGIQLFIRRARGVEPTEDAQAILPLAKKTVKTAVEIETLITEMTISRPSSINFGCISGSFNKHSFISPKVLKEMEAALPGIRLQIRECNPRDMYQMLLDGELDIACGVVCPDDDDIAARIIAKEPSRLILSRDNPLAETAAVTFEDLRNLQILSPTESPLPWEKLREAFQNAGYMPQVKQIFGTFMQTVEHVRLNEGYLVAGSAFCESLNREDLVIRPFPDERQLFTHYIFYNKKRQIQTPVRKVIRYLEAYCGKL